MTEVGGACEDARGQGGGNEMNEDSRFGISLDAFVGCISSFLSWLKEIASCDCLCFLQCVCVCVCFLNIVILDDALIRYIIIISIY